MYSYQVVVEDIDPNGKISLRPTDGDSTSRSESQGSAATEADGDEDTASGPVSESAGNGSDDDLEDFANDDFDDDFVDEPTEESRGQEPLAVSASFEDAFQAELEPVHGDLGAAPRSDRSDGRRRQSR